MAEGLRERTQQRAEQVAGAPGAEVAQRPPAQVAPAGATLADKIRMMQEQFALAAPKGVEAQQLIRDALTALRTTKNLGACEHTSVLGGLMTCAQLGLRPGVLGQAWLLPYWNANLEVPDPNDPRKTRKGGYQAQLVVGYKGLVALAYRHPQVQTVIGRTVREGELFEVDYGVADTLVHKPDLTRAPGDAIAFYALVKVKGGGHVFYVMTKPEAEQYRDRYAPRNKAGAVVGPWVDNFDEMALKSCLRQLSKWMPQSTELAQAIEADGRIHVDLMPTPAEADTGTGTGGSLVIEHDDDDDDQADAEPAGAQS